MDNRYQGFFNAIDEHNVEQVKTLLNQKDFNPTEYSYNNRALEYALENIVYFPKKSPEVMNNRVEIVELLLNWKGPKWPETGNWIDPRFENPNTAEDVSVTHLVGQCPLKIVKLFLNWKGPKGEWFDPGKRKNQVLVDAIRSKDKEIVELLLNWTGPNGEKIVPELFNEEKEIINALKHNNEEIVAMLILWYIDHKRIKDLKNLASRYPLLKTMLQRYENAKASAKVMLGLLKRQNVTTSLPRDIRKYIISEMLKESRLHPAWNQKESETKRLKPDDYIGGSKYKLKRKLIRKKSIGKKLIRKKSNRKKTNKKKKSIRKKNK